MYMRRYKSDNEDLTVMSVTAAVDSTLAAAAAPRGNLEYRDALFKVGEALGSLSRAITAQALHEHATEEAPDASAGPGSGAGFETVDGLTEIKLAIQQALDGATREILTAQPDGPRPAAVLHDALEAVRAQITSGVSMRTLYQHSTRFDEPTKEYVRAVTEHGAQVRTLAELFDRMIIVDRRTAFIPANSSRTSAIMITKPAVVNFLADIFDRAWDRAESYPFLPVRAADAAPEVIPAIRESIRKLLIEGRSDKEIARRLGLSLRSLQAHVARLKEEHGAQHRLQLGYLLALKQAGADGTAHDSSGPR